LLSVNSDLYSKPWKWAFPIFWSGRRKENLLNLKIPMK